MEFVLYNLDVLKMSSGRVSWGQSSVFLSVTVCFGHAPGQPVTGNSLCAGVMKVVRWNNVMK